jgi:stage II sporulation protein M
MWQASLTAVRRAAWIRTRRGISAWTHTLLFLTGVALCGLLFGGVVAGQLNSTEAYVLQRQLELLLNTAANHQLAGPVDLWLQRMSRDIELLGLVWLFGISVMGLPLVAIAVFLRAFTVGFSAAFTVLALGWKGLWAATALVFVHQLFSFPAVLVAGCAAIRFSGALLEREGPIEAMVGRFIRYTLMFIVCAGLAGIGAAVQALLAAQVLAGIA